MGGWLCDLYKVECERIGKTLIGKFVKEKNPETIDVKLPGVKVDPEGGRWRRRRR